MHIFNTNVGSNSTKRLFDLLHEVFYLYFMNATVYSHGQIIGLAYLKVGDATMGHVYGVFIPNAHYQTIQNVVRKFNTSINKDYSEWKSLGLKVQLNNGSFLFPKGGIMIDDLEELPMEPLHVDLAGLYI